MSGFAKIWALKWLENFIVSYFFDRPSLEKVSGVKTQRNRSHHKPQNTRPSTKHIEKNEGGESRPLLEFIENLEKGEKSG